MTINKIFGNFTLDLHIHHTTSMGLRCLVDVLCDSEDFSDRSDMLNRNLTGHFAVYAWVILIKSSAFMCKLTPKTSKKKLGNTLKTKRLEVIAIPAAHVEASVH